MRTICHLIDNRIRANAPHTQSVFNPSTGGEEKPLVGIKGLLGTVMNVI